MNESITAIALILGGFIVWMFCVRYFNEPKYPISPDETKDDGLFDIGLEPALPKYLTYRYRYNIYMFLFAFTVEALYLVITFYLPQFLGKSGHEIPELGYNATIAALIITGVLPNFTYIKTVLERMRYYFHKRAKIPTKGQELYRILRRPDISYSAEKVRRLLNHPEWNLSEQSPNGSSADILTESDFATNTTIVPARANWARLCYLLFVIKDWCDYAPWRSCISRHDLRWSAIMKLHHNLKQRIVENGGKIEIFGTDIEILLSRTYRMISCLLFMADRSGTKINDYLNELGYPDYYPTIFVIPLRQLALAAISTSAGILSGAVISILTSIVLNANGLFPMVKITTTQILLWTVYGIPFLMAPALTALLLKRYLSSFETVWPMVTPQNQVYTKLTDRPWHVYLFVSFSGCLAAFAILMFMNAAFGLLHYQASYSNLGVLSRMAIWSILGIVTAAFVAFRLDSLNNGHRSTLQKVLFTMGGSALQAVATMAAIYFAFMHTNNGGILNPFKLVVQDQTRLFIYMIMGCCIGTALFLTSRFSTVNLERRKYKRNISNQAATFYVNEKMIKGTLKNYSEEGALIKAENLPQNQTDIEKVQVKIMDERPRFAKIVKIADSGIHLQFLGDESIVAA